MDRSHEIHTVMDAWRLKTLNTVLTVVAAFGFLSLLSLFINAIGDPKRNPTNLFFLSAYTLILVLAFYRRLDWRLRAWGFMLIAYLVGIISLARGGLAGVGREYLIIIPVLATILIGVRAGIATAVLSLLVMVAFSFIISTGFLSNFLIYQHNPVDLESWLEEIAYTLVVMGVSTTLLILFNRYLLSMLAAERDASRKLEDARARLEEYSQTLEERVDQRTAELAEAYQVVEQANQRMEQELTLAGSIQTSFMSSELPHIAGWQRAASLIPARQTSGDFYDICPLGKDRYGILIGDVVDKGVGAALFMALCWAHVHAYVSQHPYHPELVLRKVNKRLMRDTHTGQFVTLFYGVLDARKGEMTYCNAGHNPPYLLRQENSLTIRSLEHTGVPLGIFHKTGWETKKVFFQSGDLLVLYTDGVTEAENSCEEFFGSQKLIAVVQENLGKSAEEVRQAIIHDLGEFYGGQPQSDDITLLVLVCGSDP